ncbi:acetate/propionate family kinase [Leucobacter massiliensis]|uniref:Acetate kinase n=1 Tax=Leucobacter massiliensis TaxID=1686285 RepID=A0A2S9QP00_9MICO|nr:acetate kinase [Leucobacter massiliensis]PRI11314.1 acetate kinase [Leucobacter massiliensis]
MSRILVINAGSSSIKYQLIDPGTGERDASGLVERIGESAGRLLHRAAGAEEAVTVTARDHSAAFAAMVEAFARHGTPIAELGIVAVGHRVVQGGSEFVRPTLIDDAVAERILRLGELAPLHNPPQYDAIVAARALFPDVPHVAVFDTAFHQTMPERAYTYAIDPAVAAEHGVRRYGFHGISHQVVSRRAAEFLGRPITDLRQVVLHLGNGASACAIDGGRSVDTSMGLTPLEGLVMGTRSGDIDPGALLHLLRAGYDADGLDRLLNGRSGLLGLAGSGDFRDVRDAAAAGDPAAELAIGVAVHRLRRYLGAYLLVLGGADAIVFTAGVGENNAQLRAEVCAGLEWFGIRVDPERNASEERGARRIGADGSRVEVLVIPTDEEAEIARQVHELLG